MFAGVDTHKDTLAVAVIDHAGRVVRQLELPNQDSGYARLLALLTSHNVVRVGVEGSGNFGWPAAIYLLEHDLNVVEVPPLMTSRERLNRPGQGKTDPVDAVAIARITAREDALPPVRPMTGHAADLRVLTEYRDQLVIERTATANRVHTDLLWLRPGYQHELPHLTNIAHLHAALELLSGDDSVRAAVTRRRLARMLTLTEQLAELRIQIDALVKASGSRLPEVYGVGPVVAATIHRPRLRRPPLPHPAPLRHRHRNSTHPSVVGAHRTAPPEPRWEPAAEPGALHDSDHPDPRRYRRPRLLPAQKSRRQDQPGSPPLPQKTAL
jgi:transposase